MAGLRIVAAAAIIVSHAGVAWSNNLEYDFAPIALSIPIFDNHGGLVGTQSTDKHLDVTLVTDGKTGPLFAGDIVSWSWSVSGGGGAPETASSLGQSPITAANALAAYPDGQLVFNWSGGLDYATGMLILGSGDPAGLQNLMTINVDLMSPLPEVVSVNIQEYDHSAVAASYVGVASAPFAAPEPSSWALFVFGLLCLQRISRRRF